VVRPGAMVMRRNGQLCRTSYAVCIILARQALGLGGQMKSRQLFAAVLIAAALFTVSCGSGSSDGVTKAESSPLDVVKPSSSVEVAWFWSDDESTLMRFVAPITNPGDKPIEGLETEWIAYDAEDSIVGSFEAERATIPAGGTLPYVGGAGGAILSGVPAKVEVRITDPGRYSSNAAPALAVTDIEFKKEEYSSDYTVTARGTTDVELTSDELAAYVILRSAAGEIVGADFWMPYNLPSTLPAGSKFTIEAALIPVSEKPDSAEVTLVVEP